MSKRYIVVVLPEEDWEFLEETLYEDSESSFFDEAIQQDIKKKMTRISKYVFAKSPKRTIAAMEKARARMEFVPTDET